MSNTRASTIKTTSVRPRQPKVDRGEEMETITRQLFKIATDRWFKENLDKDDQPDRDVKGNVVDNLAASFTSSIETLIDAATDSYLSTFGDDDEVECPHCEHVFELPEDFDDKVEDAVVVCPKCDKEFDPDADDDDPPSGEGEPVPEPERRRSRR